MTAGQSQRIIIVVHPDFDRTWPWAADHFRVLWEAQGQTEYLRLGPDDRRAVCEIVADPAGVTRAPVCDMPTLRDRVLADELALAADVWDVEPLPLDDPLLGRHNVVHTPHIAGRTHDANLAWAENLAAQFDPSGG
jgi:hypothetical protein